MSPVNLQLITPSLPRFQHPDEGFRVLPFVPDDLRAMPKKTQDNDIVIRLIETEECCFTCAHVSFHPDVLYMNQRDARTSTRFAI